MRRALTTAIVALIALGGLASAPAPAGAAPRWDAEKYAVLVGVQDYPGRVKDLVGAIGDVEDLHLILQRSGWKPENVRILTNAQATGANIRQALQWLVSKQNDTSLSVFHYSGHVKQLSGDRDRDGEALDEYLWPWDSAYISDAELTHWMRQVRGWSWVSLAGCEGAGLDDGMAAFNRLVTAASQEPEKAYEHPGWRNSVFTGLMADWGILQGKGDADRSGLVSIQEAFAYAQRYAPHVTARQSRGPQHPYIAGGDGTEWFLQLPRPPAPKSPPPAARAGNQEPAPEPRRDDPPPPPPPCSRNCEPGDDPSR